MVVKRFIDVVGNDLNIGKQRVTVIILDDTLLEKTGKFSLIEELFSQNEAYFSLVEKYGRL